MRTQYRLLPRRLLLVRHGESEANVNHEVYSTKPDWRIELTKLGHQQAFNCGQNIREMVRDENLYIYYSPYMRTRQTLEEIRKSLSDSQILGECEDERLREQEIGNYQPLERMSETWAERNEFGRLYYRFPYGESGADVGDRVSCFFNSLLRENTELSVINMNDSGTRDSVGKVQWLGLKRHDGPEATSGCVRAEGGVGDTPAQAAKRGGSVASRMPGPSLEGPGTVFDFAASPPTSTGGCTVADPNVVIISHGLLIRLFISRWFNIPAEVVETMQNPPNCSIVVLERKDDIDRLVMTDVNKDLFGGDPLLQLMKFDGRENTQMYREKFLGIILPEEEKRMHDILVSNDMDHFY